MSPLNAPPRRILVIQLRRIGDVLLTTPALSALRRRFPRAQIDFLVEPPAREIVEGHPDVSRALVYAPRGPLEALSWLGRLRSRRYDWAIDYLGNPRSALLCAATGAPVRAGPAHVFHRWAYNHPLAQSRQTRYAGLEKVLVLRELGVEPEGADWRPSLPWELRRRPENLVGLVPASRRDTRRWPAASFARLAALLRQRHGCSVAVFWGPGEEELARLIAREAGPGVEPAPRTSSLRELSEGLARCRLIVTNCNGPKHIAVALGVPTVTIHGSSDPASWNPPDPRHRVARRDELHCIGCGLNRCPTQLECLEGLSPERVLAEAAALLQGAAA